MFCNICHGSVVHIVSEMERFGKPLDRNAAGEVYRGMKVMEMKTTNQRPFLLSILVLFVLIFSWGPLVNAEETTPSAPVDTENKPVAAETDSGKKPGSFIHPEDARILSPVPGIGMLAGGGALLLTGIITGSIALSLNNDLQDSCPGDYCPPAQHDDVDRLDALAAVTDAVIPLSAALIIAGTVTYIASRRTARQYGSETSVDERGAVSRIFFSGSSLTWRF